MAGPDVSEAPIVSAYKGVDAVILLPTLNEERGLFLTLKDIALPTIRSRGWSAKPLVLDGGSTDRTRDVALASGVPVLVQRSRGKGAAVREGLDFLRRVGVRFAVVLDADTTYPGSAVLPALELLASGSDLVVGIREPEVGKPKSFRDLIHRIGNVLLNFAAGQYSRSTYLDLTSGFWAVNVQRVPELGLETDDFGIEAELFLKAHRNGWRASQIPIVYRERVGVAKLHALPDGIRILLSILRFGRRSIQASPPALSATPTILRDLLLTAFIHGHRDVVLQCPPTLQHEANAIAGRLRRTGLFPQVRVDHDLLASPPHGPGPAAGGTNGLTFQSITGSKEAVSVQFGPRGRHLHVKLTGADPSAHSPPLLADNLPNTARSGAYIGVEARSRADFLDPLRLMGRRLDVSASTRRQQLLSVNGVAPTEPAEEHSSEPHGPERRVAATPISP